MTVEYPIPCSLCQFKFLLRTIYIGLPWLSMVSLLHFLKYKDIICRFHTGFLFDFICLKGGENRIKMQELSAQLRDRCRAVPKIVNWGKFSNLY